VRIDEAEIFGPLPRPQDYAGQAAEVIFGESAYVRAGPAGMRSSAASTTIAKPYLLTPFTLVGKDTPRLATEETRQFWDRRHREQNIALSQRFGGHARG
jgi:hypothetical protein